MFLRFRPKLALLAAALALAAPLAATPLAAQTANVFAIDPGHSSAIFTVKHLVISNVRGTIPILSGTVSTASGSTVPTAIDATLDATKLDSGNPNRDGELRGETWLDVSKYPTIVFKSTMVAAAADGSFKATGDLTLHGVTKSVVLSGTTIGSTVDPRGRQHIGYSATTTIDRRDFGMVWANKTPGGDLVAANDVAISIDVEVAAR